MTADQPDSDKSIGDRIKETAQSAVDKVTPTAPEDRPPSPSGAGAPGWVQNEEIDEEAQQQAGTQE